MSSAIQMAQAVKRRFPVSEAALRDALQAKTQLLLDGMQRSEAALFEKLLAAFREHGGGERVAMSARFRCVEQDGVRMYIDARDRLIGAAVAMGVYEPHVRTALRRTLRPGDTVVDVGANIGFVSVLAASLVGPRGRVFAFEPRPENVAMMRLSLCENGFDNVIIHEVAVADREQQFKFLPDRTSSLSHVVEASRDNHGEEYFPVRAVALDDVLANVQRVDVVKIDIDGNELKAFQGMRNLLRRCRPVLFFEFAPECLRSVGLVEPESMLEEVLSQGYRLTILNEDGCQTPVEGIDAILAAQRRIGLTHIDLIGYPETAG